VRGPRSKYSLKKIRLQRIWAVIGKKTL